MKYIRNCPSCSKELTYKNKKSLYISNYNNSICRRCHNNKKLKNKCFKLLNNSLESFYWLGFLMADGHFSKNYNVNITCSTKDEEHILKLKQYLEIEKHFYTTSSIGFSNNTKSITLTFCHKPTIKKLKDLYNIKSNKTKYPPNISSITGDKFKAFKLGFIDGDGSITHQSGRKDPRITIKVHSSWSENLKYMFNRDPNITKRGYCLICIGKYEEIFDYKRFALDNNLPIMQRKWNKVILPNNQNTN